MGTSCTSGRGHRIQPGVGGKGHFVCIRCWQRFVCPDCLPELVRWFAVYRCRQHS